MNNYFNDVDPTRQQLKELQGKAIENALGALGFGGVDGVRQGKLIEVDLQAGDEATARAQLTDMCEKLLANTVIENYDIHLSEA